jgi:hypothetical protein
MRAAVMKDRWFKKSQILMTALKRNNTDQKAK